MGDLGIDGVVAMEKYKAMWLIVKNNIRFVRRPVWREEFTVRCYISKHTAVKLFIDTIIEGTNALGGIEQAIGTFYHFQRSLYQQAI